jgi:antirestriction protein ArdC
MATATKNRGRTTTSKREARDAAQEQTNAIIARLEAGTVPWHKDWTCEGGDMPTSLATRLVYRGSNVIRLWIAMMDNGWTSKYFGTYNQMAERAGMVPVVVGKNKDGSDRIKYFSPRLEDGTVDPTPRGVRKGEKSTEIIRWVFFDRPALDEDGKPVLKKDGSPLMKHIGLPFIWHVFNADQCNFPEGCKGVPTAEVREAKETIAEAEELVAQYLADGPSLGHGGDRACYTPASDHVQMPRFEDFGTAEGYFSTLYHELTHSTGHDSRLKREGIAKGSFGAFGDPVYSFEELVAELGASFLTAVAGIKQDAILDNSAAYIAHWLKALKEDKNLIIRAASQAQKAVDHILGVTFDKEEEGGE